MGKVVGHTTSRPRSARLPKNATVFCAETLRAPACVVLDALGVRGWSVQLQTGDAARGALRSFRDPRAGLRVLCVPDRLDPSTQTALKRALDPLGRNDILIVHFSTPRAVVEAVERFAGYRVGARRHVRRNTRSYLAHATLIESTVDVGYWSRYGMASAAGLALMAGMTVAWASTRGSEVETPDAGSLAAQHDPVAPPARTSKLLDQPVMSAIQTPLELDPPAARPRPRTASGEISVPTPEPRIDGELEPSPDSMPPIPLEEGLSVDAPVRAPSVVVPSAAVGAGGGAPRLAHVPVVHPVDPFGGPADPLDGSH